jgi:arabinofuranosyltransferase
MYLTDVIALQDPLLARLKAYPPDNWRVGHIERDVPRGYRETLASGKNCIRDPYLYEYYNKLLIVMKGPLFDGERLRTIFDFNCGKYDRLLNQYERNRLAHSD